jgi:hypothetical protein
MVPLTTVIIFHAIVQNNYERSDAPIHVPTPIYAPPSSYML